VQYTDRIYGALTIADPVLLDLMQSAAMQRLKGVLQHGITGLLGITRPVTRFEHSLGVMILTRRMGAPLEEQIAALLHDVSHTAFSHVIDYVFDGHDSQAYHEEMKEAYIAGSDLPQMLARHGYDWRDLLHEERYPLLEQPSPALCTDRLDYFLRDSFDLRLAKQEDVIDCLQHLVVHADAIMVDDLGTARWMGYTYIAADQASWANFREVGLYELTARALRLALRKGIISDADIWGTDAQCWARLNANADPELHELLRPIDPSTQFVWDESAPDFRLSTKLRTIDPDVLVDGQVKPLSALDPGFACYRAEYLSSKAGKWPMRVISRYS
jgi:HD superfamily phosphohydrolase